MATTPETVNLSSALVSAYKDMEYSGQERGFIAKVLSQYVPFSDEELDIWIGLFSKSNTFDYTILHEGVAKARIHAMYNNPSTKKLLNEIKKRKIPVFECNELRLEIERIINKFNEYIEVNDES